MLTRKMNWLGIIVNFLLVPTVLAGFPYLIRFAVPQRYGQLADDLVIVIIALLLNHYFWQVKLQLFNRKKFWLQLLQCLPAILFLLFSRFTTWLQVSWQKLSLRILLTVLFIALAEELIFRGLLLPLSLSLTHNHAFAAVLISSIGFGVAHLVNVFNMSATIVFLQIILVVATGILWGTVYLTTHNLSLTILLHICDDLPLFLEKSGGSLSAPNSHDLMLAAVIYLGLTVLFCGIAMIQIRLAHLNGHQHSQM